MTGDDFRNLALALEGAVEGSHMGHPDFRANGRIFASLVDQEMRGGLNLSPDEQRALMRAHPRTFSPASGAWGRSGYTMVDLTRAPTPAVRGALLLAWQRVLAMAPGPSRRRSTATMAAKTRRRATDPRKASRRRRSRR